MKKGVRIVIIVLLFVLLIVVRGFVAPYFYDPLNEYFKSDYLYTPVPEIDLGIYFLHLFFRYVLNTLISLALIYLIFQNKKLLDFASKFYLLSFIVLASILFFLLKYDLTEGYMFMFYVRRFLIHPIFIFILIPAFYYQMLKESN